MILETFRRARRESRPLVFACTVCARRDVPLAAIEAVEKVVVRVCRSVLGGLVQAATGRELFSSAGKLVNDFFVDVVATRLMQASSAMAFQVLPLLVQCGL